MLPLGVILIVHLILFFLCLCKIITLCGSNSAKDDSEYRRTCTSSSCDKTIQCVLVAVVTISLTFFSGWTFGLLSINPDLHKYSNYFQAIFAIFTSTQGILVLIYGIYSHSDAQKFWTKTVFRDRFKFLRTTEEEDHIYYNNHVATDSTSTGTNFTTSSLAASSTVTADDKKDDERSNGASIIQSIFKRLKGNSRANGVIPTETNQAYETVVIDYLKRHKYKITSNEAYASVGST